MLISLSSSVVSPLPIGVALAFSSVSLSFSGRCGRRCRCRRFAELRHISPCGRLHVYFGTGVWTLHGCPQVFSRAHGGRLHRRSQGPEGGVPAVYRRAGICELSFAVGLPLRWSGWGECRAPIDVALAAVDIQVGVATTTIHTSLGEQISPRGGTRSGGADSLTRLDTSRHSHNILR